MSNYHMQDRDGTVQGSSGDDLIDIAYLGDPDGDVVDGADAILPGAAANDDLILGYEGNDIVYAGAGDDAVSGGLDDDQLYGGDGDDSLAGDEGQDLIFAGAGNDALEGGSGDDTLKGGSGEDLLTGGTGVDWIAGEDDADTLVAGSGDFADGGNGGDDNDTLDLRGLGAFVFEGLTPDSNGNGQNGTVVFVDADGVPTGETIVFEEIEAFLTDDDANDNPDAVDDAVTAISGTPITVAVLANDTDPDGDSLSITGVTNGTNGVVTIDDTTGNPIYTPDAGFVGTDTFTYTVDDGNGGTDTAAVTVVVSNDTGPDGTVEGTDGDDLIDVGYVGDPEGDLVDNNDALLPGEVGNDDLIYGYGGNDTVIAGEGDDEVYGGAGNDDVQGNVGNDLIFGRGGDDVLSGGEGDDEVYGGAGNDQVTGAAGNDTLYGRMNDDSVTGGSGDDEIWAGYGDDSVSGGSGVDTVYGGGGDDTIDSSNGGIGLFDNPYPPLPADPTPLDDLDTVYAGAGNDTVRTGDDADTIFGGLGDDTLDAGIDDDVVSGGQGNDTIVGGEGNDVVRGNLGNDTIYGGLSPLFPDSLNIPDDEGDLVPDNGLDQIYGGLGDDTIYGMDDDDTIYGDQGNDTIDGGVDDDVAFGGTGNDTLTGGQGNDDLSGGNDRDVFLGGNGGDVVDGGGGGDDFDVLNLTGSGVDFITYTSPDREDGTVTFLDGSTMTFTEIENVVPCFTPGTTIATPKGERLVQDLKVGDRIITRDNGIQEIRWVGRKDVSGRDLVATPHLRPILIRAGALGNGLPERDMLVSPNHRILVSNDRTQLYFEENEVLAAAKHLVGSAGIMELEVMQTSYIHFMFDRHEVVLSNGAWTESFQPGDQSLKGIGNSQRNEIYELFPELATEAGIESYQSARKSLKKHEARLLVK